MRHARGVLSLGLCALGPVMMSGSTASAQAFFDAERFVPAAGAASDLTLESPVVLDHLEFGGGLFLNIADDPLVLREIAGDEIVGRPIDTDFSADLMLSLGLFRYLALGIHLPVHLISESDPDLAGGLGAASSGVGDLRIVPKATLFGSGDADHHFVLGFALPVSLPTGDETEFRGAGGVNLTPTLSALWQLQGFGLGAALGYMWRQEAPDLYPWGDELRMAITANYEFTPNGVALLGEINGGQQLGTAAEGPTLGLEGLLGVRAPISDSWKLFAGGGLGLATQGLGTPDFRAFAGVRFASHMPNRNGFGDSDGDGIADRDDECKHEPEDEDGFQDDDGCPEPDNDEDGIPDDVDECPELPDDDNDGDGCPSKTYVTIVDGQMVVFGKVQFRTASDEVSAKSQNLLDQVAVALKSNPDVEIRIVGHTDDVGGDDVNKKLSQDRADSVKRELSKRGIDEDRLSTRGNGEEMPIAPNRTNAGRTKNRRVEFQIIQGDE